MEEANCINKLDQRVKTNLTLKGIRPLIKETPTLLTCGFTRLKLYATKNFVSFLILFLILVSH